MTTEALNVYGPADVVGPLLIGSPLDIPSLDVPPEEVVMRVLALEAEVQEMKWRMAALTGGKDYG